MPAVLPDGLDIGAVLEREDPRDALVLPNTKIHEDPNGRTKIHEGHRECRLAEGARIGTGSVRRIAQLKALFPGASFENVRGNLDTRLRKLDAGDYDLLVLAAAGLRRLGFASRISATVPLEDCVPAPGQGIIAVEIRSGDEEARKAVARINDRDAIRRARSRARAGRRRSAADARCPSAASPCRWRTATSSFTPSSHHSTARAPSAIRRLAIETNAAGSGQEVASNLLANGAEAILKEARQIQSLESRIPNPCGSHKCDPSSISSAQAPATRDSSAYAAFAISQPPTSCSTTISSIRGCSAIRGRTRRRSTSASRRHNRSIRKPSTTCWSRKRAKARVWRD